MDFINGFCIAIIYWIVEVLQKLHHNLYYNMIMDPTLLLKCLID